MYRRTNPSVVKVEFRCLNCGKQGLYGTQNTVTGELVPSGLKRHIKQKKIKGVYSCKQHYELLGELDYHSSLVNQPQPEDQASMGLEDDQQKRK